MRRRHARRKCFDIPEVPQTQALSYQGHPRGRGYTRRAGRDTNAAPHGAIGGPNHRPMYRYTGRAAAHSGGVQGSRDEFVSNRKRRRAALMNWRFLRLGAGANGANQSQSAVEPVSVSAANFRRESVSQRQRPGADFEATARLFRAAEIEICRVSLAKGPGTQRYFDQQVIMEPALILDDARRIIAQSLGRQDCGPIDKAPPAQALSRWHHADQSRQ
jgi:hypothetical protein